jgi:hypothetical protein
VRRISSSHRSRARRRGSRRSLIGDTVSPSSFELEGCEFFSVEAQRALKFRFARDCPVRHYARKNIGYLIAMDRKAPVIVETDDDSAAFPAFWLARGRDVEAPLVSHRGWVNVYRYFTQANVWPRGLPLDQVRVGVPAPTTLSTVTSHCPIQQGLVDDDPDVDAIYRLLFELPLTFEANPPVVLAEGAWCPFNSQNTTWFPEAYPLLYLPAFSSFRMTDIWRSLVAQAIASANGWRLSFHASTISQDRNDHDLMRDFADEIPGYRHNASIAAALGDLDMEPGVEHLGENMKRAYGLMVDREWLDPRELLLLSAWLEDVDAIGSAPSS